MTKNHNNFIKITFGQVETSWHQISCSQTKIAPFASIKAKVLAQLFFCRFDGWGKHDCERTEAAGVICKPMPPTTTPPPPTTTPRPKIEIHKTHGHYLKARLSGGRDLNEGTYHGENLICSLATMGRNQFSKSIGKAKFFQAGFFVSHCDVF